jgi:hypothetical protein
MEAGVDDERTLRATNRRPHLRRAWTADSGAAVVPRDVSLGRPCEIDLDDWAATQRDHYPDEDLGELAKQAGLPVTEVRATVDETLPQ